MNNKDSKKITLKTKHQVKGYDGHKTISVRMSETLFLQLEDLADRTNRSRNQLINMLLEQAIEIAEIED